LGKAIRGSSNEYIIQLYVYDNSVDFGDQNLIRAFLTIFLSDFDGGKHIRYEHFRTNVTITNASGRYIDLVVGWGKNIRTVVVSNLG